MKHEFLNIEPLLIYVDHDTWVHPEIEKYIKWDEDNINEGDYMSENVYRYDYSIDNKSVHVIFLCPDINDDDDSFDTTTMTSAKIVHDNLEVVLMEDIWMPGGNQFCFTEIGEKVSNVFKQKGKYKYWYSPDVCIHSDDEGSYCYST